MAQTLDIKIIEQLRDIKDLTPVSREYFEDWNIRVFNREEYACKNYLSPNRRDFYKILFITKGIGLFTMGANTYYIEEPTILFIHPNEIISWRNLSDESAGYYCLFKKRYIEQFPSLKSILERYPLFNDSQKSIVRLNTSSTDVIDELFTKMHQESLGTGDYREDSLQAYIQLIVVETMKAADFPKPAVINDELRHVYHFFQLLEEEAAHINYNTPLRIKTAKEFAAALAIHPNYLNAVLKKHTGQNVSTHIRSRILEESKTLLVQTDWPLQEIGFAIGFADQPNFNQFFKKNTGVSPNEFRKSFKNKD
ncbi:AraC family transcriptional regulator [Sphingobacterium sp. MYb382]|uniref:AraC family transcriptional regulator n=1 Tax=Sphingobacterium sp. MYb382 TaxID=2745278 RepID=UPI0030A104BD